MCLVTIYTCVKAFVFMNSDALMYRIFITLGALEITVLLSTVRNGHQGQDKVHASSLHHQARFATMFLAYTV